MEFRSHAQGTSSSKGKEKITYVDSSDEDGHGVTKPYSDYEGEGLFDGSEENGRGLTFDLNSHEISNEDLHCNLAKKRKTSSAKSSVEESLKVQLKQEEENREMDIDIKTGEYTEPFELVNSQVLLEKTVTKKKSKKNIGDNPVLIWEDIEEEQKKWVEENWYKLIDLNHSINENKISAETVEPSDDLTVPLLRYQKEWLAWALNQENSPIKGGILADEMGIGKTLEAIALVLLRRKISGEIYRHEAASSSCFSDKEPSLKSTLVVCPLGAVMQWVDEIDRFTSQGSTKVLVYHGANHAKKCNNLSDIVITTYSIVEVEYRKYGKCHNDGMKPDSGGDKEMEIPPQGKPILH